MSYPVLDFTTDDWVNIPKEASAVQISISARPPVSASAGVLVFARASNVPDAPWQKIKSGGVDNIPGTSEGASLSFDVQPGTLYSLKLQGQAHLLMPEFSDIAIGMSLSATGEVFCDYGGEKVDAGRAAIINGFTYLRYEV